MNSNNKFDLTGKQKKQVKTALQSSKNMYQNKNKHQPDLGEVFFGYCKNNTKPKNKKNEERKMRFFGVLFEQRMSLKLG